MIKILSEQVINKIAAGEVIERPFSIIKELVENSIDAHATKINIEIFGGCLNYMRVEDNGTGFEEEDIELAFLRHATSKIENDNDLFSINTLGFRGEALASIAAVSKLTLTTKQKKLAHGYRYEIDFGIQQGPPEAAACDDGTVFVIEKLFDNVPVRKNFLNSDTTEASKICDIVEKIALSHPSISFKVIIDKKERLVTSGNGKVDEIIYEIYGKDVYKNIIEVRPKDSDKVISISGYIGSPILARNNRNDEIFFVNGRYIKSEVLSLALEDAYKNFLMQHKFPFSVLYIDIDKTKVDVNVHPKKEEIRFSDEKIVYENVKSIIYDALSEKTHVRDIESDVFKKPIEPHYEMGQALKQFPFTKEELEQKIDAEFEKRENSWEAVDRTNILYDTKTQYVADSGLVFSKANSDASKSNVVNENDYGQNLLYEKKENELQNGYKIIGQLFNTYILCETKNSLYIIDQHAAHEKVNYERYVKQIKSKQIESMNLLTGFIITLTNAQMDTFLKYQNYFNELGFNIEEFGDREIKINSIPVVIGSLDKKEIFLEILDGLSLMPSFKDPEIVLDKIASMSCKAAIKGHDKLSIKEQEYLIDELLTLENPYNCPHGRPTIIAMTKYELEKKFKRIV